MSEAAPGGPPPSVLLVNAFHRDTTGADRHCRELAALLAKRGHRVAPFAARHAENDDAGEWARFFPEGAATAASARPGLVRRARDAGKLVYHLEARRRARDVAGAFRPDVVHAHNLFHHLSPSVLPPLRSSGAAVVMTLHDYKLVCPNYTLYTQGGVCTACRGGRFGHAVTRRCVRDSTLLSAICAVENAIHWNLGLYERSVDLFLSPSRFLVERFVDFGYPPEKFRVLPHFVDLPDETAEAEEDFVLFAGRFVEVKGLATLLEAWGRTRARTALRLVLAGDGPLRAVIAEEVRARSLDGVELPGLLTRDELGRLMSRAVAVVMPSLWYEVFGLVALEALARGRAVIASRIGGLEEVVEDRRSGILVPPGDPDALARAIDEVAASPSLRRSLGEEGRRRAATRFSPEAFYGGLRAVYDEARARRGRA